jgi:hypothetical protein
MTSQEIFQQYPGLEEADIVARIACGAEMTRERHIEIPPGLRPDAQRGWFYFQRNYELWV